MIEIIVYLAQAPFVQFLFGLFIGACIIIGIYRK